MRDKTVIIIILLLLIKDDHQWQRLSLEASLLVLSFILNVSSESCRLVYLTTGDVEAAAETDQW